MAVATVVDTSGRFLRRWLWDSPGRLFVGVAISVVLDWLAVRGIEWGLVVDQFQDFPAGWAVAALAIILLASVLRAYRWQVLFVRQKLPLTRLFLIQNAGIGLNNAAPVRVVSEGAQFALRTLRYRVKGGVALGTLGMERILDLVVTAALLMAGLALLPGRGEFLPYVVGAFVVAVASVLAIPLVIRISSRPFLNRIPLLVSASAYLSDLTSSWGTLSYAFFLSLVYWLMVGLCAWVLAFGMGVGITPFVATLAILGTLFFATSLPALPAAAGTFEFAIVYVLKAFGVSQALAFSYAVVIHAVLFLPPIVIAILVFSSIGLKPLTNRGGARPAEEITVASIHDQKRRTK